MSRDPASIREEALALLSDYGPEYDVPGLAGLSNHGPMVVDALLSLGADAKVLPWVRAYVKQLGSMPEQIDVVSAIDWQRALGDLTRFSDWVGFFQRQLLWMNWDDVIAEWTPILAPGLSGAAGHGLLRTAHAVRGISDEPTDRQKIELAHGLAYWASTFLPLPGCPLPRHRTTDTAHELLQRLTPRVSGSGLISDDLAALVDHPGIMAATVALDTSGDPLHVVTRIAEASALSLLANPVREKVIAQVHGITVSVALLYLLPYIPAGAIAFTLTYGWQFVVGLHAITHEGKHFPELIPVIDDAEFSMLVQKCIDSNDEHLIKFADAVNRLRSRDQTGTLSAALLSAFELLA